MYSNICSNLNVNETIYYCEKLTKIFCNIDFEVLKSRVPMPRPCALILVAYKAWKMMFKPAPSGATSSPMRMRTQLSIICDFNGREYLLKYNICILLLLRRVDFYSPITKGVFYKTTLYNS